MVLRLPDGLLIRTIWNGAAINCLIKGTLDLQKMLCRVYWMNFLSIAVHHRLPVSRGALPPAEPVGKLDTYPSQSRKERLYLFSWKQLAVLFFKWNTLCSSNKTDNKAESMLTSWLRWSSHQNQDCRLHLIVVHREDADWFNRFCIWPWAHTLKPGKTDLVVYKVNRFCIHSQTSLNKD